MNFQFYFKNNPLYASPLKRILSFIVDFLIIIFIYFFITNILNKINIETNFYKEEVVLEKLTDNTESKSLNLAQKIDYKVYRKMYFLFLFISFAYFVFFLSSKKQATIGNQIFKIIVIHTKNQQLTALNVFIRCVALLLNNSFYFLGYFFYFIREDHAFMHDLMSDTRVINLLK